MLPADHRDCIALHVVLPVLYTSNILTHLTHPIIDIIAWLYAIIHYTFLLVLAALLSGWLFHPSTLRVFAKTLGYQKIRNCMGVCAQIAFPWPHR